MRFVSGQDFSRLTPGIDPTRFVSGHDFSHAAKRTKIIWGFSP